MSEIKNIDDVQIPAIVKEGWRSRALDADRLIFVHPDHAPRVVEIASIKPGDTLPRNTDEEFSFPPAIAGN